MLASSPSNSALRSSRRLRRQERASRQYITRCAWYAVGALALSGGGCADLPPISASVDGPQVTCEAGGAVNVMISLSRAPRGVVIVEATSDDPSEGVTSGALRFDARNWERPQTITVTGVDDDLDDGNVQYAVRLRARSARAPADEPFEFATLFLFNQDDETSSFVALGDLPGGSFGSLASDINPAGDVVVGWSQGEVGEQAMRWTRGSGLEALDERRSRAAGVSANGTMVAGYIQSELVPGGVWRAGGPFEPLYEPGPAPEAPTPYWMVAGVAVLDSGVVYGNCVQYGLYSSTFACRSERTNHISPIGGASLLHRVDEQGDYVGVLIPDPRNQSGYGAQAIFNGEQLGYPEGSCNEPHNCRAEARAFSADGAVIVGTSLLPAVTSPPYPTGEVPLFETAFVYMAAGGMRRLPDLLGGEEASGAYAITSDGRIVGGFGTSDGGREAVVWIDGTPISLQSMLTLTGSAPPSGWRLLEVVDFAADGRTFVGNAHNQRGEPEAFVAVLPVQ